MLPSVIGGPGGAWSLDDLGTAVARTCGRGIAASVRLNLDRSPDAPVLLPGVSVTAYPVDDVLIACSLHDVAKECPMPIRTTELTYVQECVGI
jgi:hypothetical protein